MERLKSLKHRDIKMANSLARVLNLLDLTEDDLLLLKDIKKLKEENEDLKERIAGLELELSNMQKIRFTQEAKEFLAQSEGETLNV